MARAATRSVQMNVRLDEDLKKKGDSAFSKAGITPSEAVRALWQFAIDHASEPSAIAKQVSELQNAESEEDALKRQQRIRAASAMYESVDAFFAQRGASLLNLKLEPLPDEALYEQAMIDHFSEKGVIQ